MVHGKVCSTDPAKGDRRSLVGAAVGVNAVRCLTAFTKRARHHLGSLLHHQRCEWRHVDDNRGMLALPQAVKSKWK